MHVAITGASSGIGLALAREFSAAGARVTLVARRRALLEEVARELPGPSFVCEHDLADAANAAGWVPSAEAALGPIDVLINNAGVMFVGPTADYPAEDASHLLELDLHSPLRLTRAVLPHMLERGSGTIVNVASVAALVPVPSSTWYSAAKAGLAAYSEALRGELRGSGVNVLTVYPGPVDTPLAQASYDAVGRGGVVGLLPLGTTSALAKRVRAAVERRRARVIYPRIYALSRYFPAIARIVVDAGMPRTRPTLPPARPAEAQSRRAS